MTQQILVIAAIAIGVWLFADIAALIWLARIHRNKEINK